MAPDPFDSRTFVREVASRFHLGDLQMEIRVAKTGAPSDLRGADLLKSDSVDTVVARLANGDPLDLVNRSRKYLYRKGLILDLERVARTTVAYAAFLAVRDEYDGDPPLQAFLENAIEQSVATISEEDRASEMRGDPMDPIEDPYMRIDFGSAIDPAHVRHAVLRFNAMHESIRVPCYRAMVEGASFAEAVEGTELSPEELSGHVEGMIEVIGNPPKLEFKGSSIDDLLDRILANTRRKKR